MDSIVALITELGSFGLLLGLAGFIIYNYVKEAKPNGGGKTNDGINKNEIKNEIKEMLNESTKDIKGSIDAINTKVNQLENKMNSSLAEIKGSASNSASVRAAHSKQFLDRLKLGPQLHKTLNIFRDRVNADHIFIGSFHNGNESITGIPYYKFDIIAERFRPDKVDRDIEFAFMYKDADLLRHDLLPAEVVQRGTVHYIIEEDGTSPLADIDDIIYRRMIGRDIKQLAISLLRDPDGTPSGFVGCVRYDYEEMDVHELKECGLELENVYSVNEKVIQNTNK